MMIRKPGEVALMEQVVTILQNLDMSTGPMYNIANASNLLRLLNYNPSNDEIEAFTEQLDPNKCDQFSPKEFIALLKEFKFSDRSDDAIMKALAEIDGDNDGIISSKEFVDIMTNYSDTLNEFELKELMKDIEVDSRIKITDIMAKFK